MKTHFKNNGALKNFGKGLIGLFAIKLILFGGALLLESCNKDSMKDELRTTKETFIKSVNMGFISLNKLTLTQEIAKTQSSSTTKRSVRPQEDYAIISIYSLPGNSYKNQTFPQTANLEYITTIDGTEVGVSYADGRSSDNILQSYEVVTSYQISVQAAQQSLQPILSEAKNYLYSKGLTDSDINELLAADSEGPAMSESDLIPTVMQLIAEEQNQQVARNSTFLSIFGAPAHASEIGQCAGDALGVSAIAGAIAGGLHTEAGKALLKKSIRKVAGKALGWVGAAIFTYEFGDCMNWW